jgi:hypothetical protein
MEDGEWRSTLPRPELLLKLLIVGQAFYGLNGNADPLGHLFLGGPVCIFHGIDRVANRLDKCQTRRTRSSTSRLDKWLIQMSKNIR